MHPNQLLPKVIFAAAGGESEVPRLMLQVSSTNKVDDYTMDAALAVLKEMYKRKQKFLPATVIRKILRPLHLTDLQRQYGIKYLQGRLGISNRSQLLMKIRILSQISKRNRIEIQRNFIEKN